MLIIYISKKLTCHTCDTNIKLIWPFEPHKFTVTCVENPGSSVVLETEVHGVE